MEYDWEKPEHVMIALITLFEQQTKQEQNSGATVEQNYAGFNAVDAPILSSFASQIIVRRRRLSDKQLNLARGLLHKYWRQLSTLNPLSLPDLEPTAKRSPNSQGTLRIDGDKLIFTPRVYPSGQIKSLGFTWLAKEKGWQAPLREPLIRGVMDLFSPIDVDESVENFLDLANVPVELSDQVHKSSLYEKQKEAVAFVKKGKRVLLGMRPGTGKTASSIFAVNELTQYDDVLVVCPLSLCRNWQNEIKKWIGEDSVIWHGQPSTWSPYRKWVITNYDTFIRQMPSIQAQSFKVVIFDESIVMKNRKTVRSAKASEFSKNMDYVILLSGAPVAKFADDLWSQFHVLDSRRFSSYWRFVDQYCEKEQTQWGTSITGNQHDALFRIRRDCSDIFFTCTLEDLKDVPDWIFEDIEVPMSSDQYRMYDEMERNFLANLPDGDVVLAPNVLSQLLRLVQISSNPILLNGPDDGAKWKAVEELLEFKELPAIIWTTFIHTADLMVSKLRSKKLRVERLTGATDPSVRQDIVDKFQRGEIDVLVAHPAVGKFGLTLTKARTMIYLEMSFNGDDYNQSLYRVKRITTELSPNVIHLLAVRPSGSDRTIDHVIRSVLEFRKNQNLQITGSSSPQLTSGMIREMLRKPKENE